MGRMRATGKTGRASSGFLLVLGAVALGLVLVGCSGEDGAVGPGGPAGPPGPAGAMGPAGADGAAGPAGPAGAAGARGAAGPAGPAGPSGPAGADGASGSTGAAGAAGAAGSGTVVPGAALASGKAIKGPIVNGTVVLSIYADNNGGTCPTVAPTTVVGTSGALERCTIGASGTTDANGGFALTIPDDQSSLVGPLHVEVFNGTFIDEVTGLTNTGPQGPGINSKLRTLVPLEYLDDLRPAGGAANVVTVAISALTELATTRALGAGTGTPTAGQAHAANTQTASLFALTDIDIARTLPSDITNPASSSDSDESKRYGIVNAAFSQLAQVVEGDQDVLDIVRVVGLDYQDGIFDAKGRLTTPSDAALTLPGSSRKIPAATMGPTLASAIETIQSSSVNNTGMTLDAAAVATIRGAHLASNNILTLTDNGCIVADARLPSGSFIFTRAISTGIATLRNSVGGNGSVDGSGFLAVSTANSANSFFSAQSVNIRCVLANFSQGATALGDRGSGQITVSPRFTIRDATADDATNNLAAAAHKTGSKRTVTGTLSAMTINNNPTGVTGSQPEGTTITITGMRDVNGSTIRIDTPLPPSSILNQGGNVVRFVPNALIGALSAKGLSQFDTLAKDGIFVYEVTPGFPVYLHANAGSTTESNAPPAARPQTCNGNPDGTTTTSGTGFSGTSCVNVTTVRGSLEVKQ